MGTIRYEEARTHFSELLDQEKASRAWHQSLSLGSGTRGRCSHVEALNIARCPPEESIVGVVLVQVANVHPRVGGAFHQSRGRSRRSGPRGPGGTVPRITSPSSAANRTTPAPSSMPGLAGQAGTHRRADSWAWRAIPTYRSLLP